MITKLAQIWPLVSVNRPFASMALLWAWGKEVSLLYENESATIKLWFSPGVWLLLEIHRSTKQTVGCQLPGLVLSSTQPQCTFALCL
jgi:hypothetical protein